MFSGVVFDMDGTLVDTEHVHFDAWNTVFGQFGIGPFEAEWFAQWIGRSAPSLGAQMKEDYEQITIDATELVARKEVSQRLVPGCGTIGVLSPVAFVTTPRATGCLCRAGP